MEIATAVPQSAAACDVIQPRSPAVDDDSELKAMKDALARQRGYAGFFDWPDKQQKEAGLLNALAEAAAHLGINMTACETIPPGQDPPDAEARVGGRKVAIEFTEFVDQEMIRLAKTGGAAPWRWWTQEEAIAHLKSRIATKDHAGFGSTTDYWLVIHCDEPALDSTRFTTYLGSTGALSVHGITRCFLLLSYEPAVGRKPLLEVCLATAT